MFGKALAGFAAALSLALTASVAGAAEAMGTGGGVLVDGREFPMSIDGDAMSDSLRLDQGDELGQTLYRLILSKPLQVVGDQKIRNQIASDAAVHC
jgi:hypothetical protein